MYASNNSSPLIKSSNSFLRQKLADLDVKRKTLTLKARKRIENYYKLGITKLQILIRRKLGYFMIKIATEVDRRK